MCKRLLLFALFAISLSANAAPAILIFGDSLSAGYGIAVEQSWPALLAKRLENNRLHYTVSNASISGETTAGGRARFDEALRRVQPEVVVIALGANDGLRALPTYEMQLNLTAMIKTAKAAKARVLLIGIRLPPNYGPTYVRQFEESFLKVARAANVPLLPFLLEPLGAGNEYFQPDGLHPTAAAQQKIADHVWPALKPLLR